MTRITLGEGTARYGSVQGKFHGGLPAFVVAGGPDTLCIFRLSYMH